MHYFENEIIMSIPNALALKSSEITVLEHVRTYEYEDDELLPFFVEIRSMEHGTVVRKNRILDFPLYKLEEEQHFSTTEAAIEVFQKWITEIR